MIRPIPQSRDEWLALRRGYIEPTDAHSPGYVVRRSKSNAITVQQVDGNFVRES